MPTRSGPADRPGQRVLVPSPLSTQEEALPRPTWADVPHAPNEGPVTCRALGNRDEAWCPPWRRSQHGRVSPPPTRLRGRARRWEGILNVPSASGGPPPPPTSEQETREETSPHNSLCSPCGKADAGCLWRTLVHGHGESGERPSGLHPCPAGGTGRPGGFLCARPDFRHSPLLDASQLGPGTSHVPSPASQPAPGTTAGISHAERGKNRVLPQCLMPSTCKSCWARDENILNRTWR